MKNQLKKKLKKININIGDQKIIKLSLKLLKKINLKKFGEATTESITKTFINFKKKQQQKERNRINFEKKEKIRLIKQEKLVEKKQKLDEEKQIKKNYLDKLKEEKQRLEDKEKQRLKIEKQYQ